MGSLRTEHGGKLEVSRVHSRDAVCSSGKHPAKFALQGVALYWNTSKTMEQWVTFP